MPNPLTSGLDFVRRLFGRQPKSPVATQPGVPAQQERTYAPEAPTALSKPAVAPARVAAAAMTPPVVPSPDPSASSPGDVPTALSGGGSSPGDAPTALSGGGSSPGDAPTALSGGGRGSTPGTAGRFLPGHKLGARYEILAVLGEGGMGAVYKARDLELDRVVALKVIRPEMAADPGIIDRFKREIILSSKVTHKNVVRIHDLGQADGVQFISMSFVEGQSLNDVLRAEGALPVARALPLIRQISEALAAAHDVGVVHRDLKPQNILVDKENNAYIADFGISRSMESGGTMTEAGMLIGTVEYMSPEQARGEVPDQRSDIYSLGLIIYQMLTGDLPFQGHNVLSVMLKRVHEDAPVVKTLRPDLPAWLSTVVARALARNPVDRYQQVRELLADIDRQATSMFYVPRAKRRRIIVPVVALIAVIAVGLLAYRYLPRRGEGAAAEVAVAPKASLVVLPLANRTGDPQYDWVRTGLSSLLTSDLRQAKALRLAGEDRVDAVLDGLKLAPNAPPSANDIQRIASLLTSENVLTTNLIGGGGRFKLEAIVNRVGATTVEPGAALVVEGQGNDALFGMVDQLTAKIRAELGVSEGRGESSIAAGDLSTKSVDAMQAYSAGLSALREGRDLDAAVNLERALEFDSKFAIAGAALADTYDRLGQKDKASSAADRALQGLDRVSPYEAERVRAVSARVRGDLDTAETGYRALVDASPNSADVYIDLADVRERKGDLEGALGALRKALTIDPKHTDALYRTGRVLARIGRPDEALAQFNNAQTLLTASGNDEGLATVLNGFGNVYLLNQHKAEQAELSFKGAEEIQRKIGDKRGLASTLNNIILLRLAQQRLDDAVGAAEEATKLWTELGSNAGLARCYSNLGQAYLEFGKTKEALETFKRELAVVEFTSDIALKADADRNLGNSYVVLGNYLEARHWLNEALDKRTKLGMMRELAQSLSDTADAELFIGRYEDALKHYLQALDMAKQRNSKGMITVLSGNVSNVYEARGEYSSAFAQLDTAEGTARETNDEGQILQCSMYRGSLLRRIGDLAGAEAALTVAEKGARAAEDVPMLAEVLIHRGDLLLAQGPAQKSKASAVLQEAVKMSKQAGDLRLELQSRRAAAQAKGSIEALLAVIAEARAAGLAPVEPPARLALARLHRAAGRAGEALDEAELGIKAAREIGQRDELFQLLTEAGGLLMSAKKTEDAADRFTQALTTLEDMRRGLSGPTLTAFLQRPACVSFGKAATPVLTTQAPETVEKLEQLLRP